MKTLPFFLAFVLWTALPLHADLTITQDVEQTGGPKPGKMALTIMIKGHMVRMDLNPQVSALHDLSTGDTTTLVHPQKMAMKIPADMMKKMKAARDEKRGEAAALVDTGNKDTINGFACEEYDTSVQGMKVQMWVTKDAPDAQKVMTELKSLSDDLDPLGGALSKQDIPGFPVRTVITMPDNVSITTTVVKLNTDTLPDSDFTIPDGYKPVDAPAQMMGQ